MLSCDTLIRNASSSGRQRRRREVLDVALCGRANCGDWRRRLTLQRAAWWKRDGLVLAPGFIDVHTHDDICVIRKPEMLPKLSQGVTTVIVGNCGISAAPVTLRGELPDPMNLLGDAEEFRYPTFARIC